jgi:hypothetical protein
MGKGKNSCKVLKEHGFYSEENTSSNLHPPKTRSLQYSLDIFYWHNSFGCIDGIPSPTAECYALEEHY